MNRSIVKTLCGTLALATGLCSSTAWGAPSISGTITNASAAGVNGAYVYAYQVGGNAYGYSYGDGSGHYTVNVGSAGTFRVRCSYPPYLGQYYGPSTFEDGATNVEVGAASDVTGIDIMLPDGDWIEGHVYDNGGHPLDSAGIYGSASDDNPYFWWYPYGQTDATGYYRITGLPAALCVLQADRTGYLPLYYDDSYYQSGAHVFNLTGMSHESGIDFHVPLGARFNVAVYDAADGLPLHNADASVLTSGIVNALIRDTTGPVWVGTDAGVTGFVSGATIGLHAFNAGLPNAPVRALARTPNGNLLVGTDNGLAVHHTWGTVIFTTTNSALPDDHITALAVSATGAVWIGMQNGTLARLAGTTFTTWTSATRGLPGPTPITCLSVNPANGNLWIGCGDGAQYYTGGASFPRVYTSNSSLPSNTVLSIAAATDGFTFIGTSNGLLRTNLTTETVLKTAQGLPSNYIYSISLAHHRDAWLGTGYGMARVLNEAVSATYNTGNSNIHQYSVSAILAAGDTVYAGGSSGVDIFWNAAFQWVTAPAIYVQLQAQGAWPNANTFYGQVYGSVAGEIVGMPGGEYRVHVSNGGYASQWYMQEYSQSAAQILSVTLSMTYPETLVFAMERPASISGMVEDNLGAAVGSGDVIAVAKDHDELEFSGSISAGAYTITGISPGDYYVYAQVSGYPPGFYGGGFNRGSATLVEADGGDDITGIDIVVTNDFENGSISGRVTDAHGHPFPFASLNLQGVDDTSEYEYASADARGEFMFPSVPPGTFQLYANVGSRPGLYYPGTYYQSQARRVYVNSGQARTGVDLIAPDADRGMVQGVVTNASSNAVADARVVLSDSITYPEALSSATGFYRITGVWPSDDLYLSVQKTGYPTYYQYNIAVATGQTRTINVNLGAPFPAGTKLAGTIYDGSGNRVWGSQIYGSVGGNSLDTVYSEWDGHYEYDPAPAANIDLTIYTSYLLSVHSNVTPVAGMTTINDITLQYNLSGYGVIWGHVYDASGQPQPGLQVHLSGAGSRTVATNADGVYVAAGLSPGAWTVQVTSFGAPYPEVTGVVITSGLVVGDVDLTVPLRLGRISGTVRNEMGTALAYPELDEEPVNHSHGAPYRYTDARGNYTLCGLRQGLYVVYAEVNGYAREYYSNRESRLQADALYLATGQVLTGIDFSLPRALMARGTVRTTWNEPIFYGSVYAYTPNLQESLGSTYTDALGGYSLSVSEPGAFVVQAQVDGYAFQYYNHKDPHETPDVLSGTNGQILEPVDFLLAGESVISGTVVNASDEAYTCGYVYALPVASPERFDYYGNINGEGQFSVAGLPPGTYALQAYVCGKPGIFLSNAFNVASASLITVGAGATVSGVRFEVPDTVEMAELSGHVTAPGGLGLPYVYISVQGADGTSYSNTAYTDAQGFYHFEDLPPGVFVVAYQQDNQPPYYYGATYSMDEADRVALNPGQSATNIDIQVPAFTDFAMLSGVVRDTLSHPIAGAQLTLWDTYYYLTIQSGPDGSYAFYDLHPSLTLNLSVQKPGYRSGAYGPFSFSPNASVQQDVTLIYQGGYMISGVVRNASGSPISGAYVSVTGIDRADAFYAYANSFGEYRIGPAPMGLYWFEASSSGYGTAMLDSQTVNADRQWDAVLPWSADHGTVSGQVVDASGRPAYGVRVYSQGPTSRNVYTDLDGRYYLAGLTAGSYRIYLGQEQESGYPEQTGVPVTADQITEDVDFVLSVTYGTIRGAITNATHEALVDVPISTNPIGHNWYPSAFYTGLSGQYVVARVRSGPGRDYRVYAHTPGYAPSYYMHSLSANQATIVSLPAASDATGIDIQLDDAGAIAGRVVDRLGRSLPGASMTFTRRDEPQVTYYYDADAQGQYEATELPPGRYQVQAYHDGYLGEYFDDQLNEQEADLVDVAAGMRHTGVDFALIHGAGISGMVQDSSGAAVTSGYVYAVAADPDLDYNASSSLDGEGKFAFVGLPPGGYYLYAQVSGRPVVFYPSAYSRNSATLVSASDEQSIGGLVITIPTGSVAGGTIAGRVWRHDGFPYPDLDVRIWGADGTSGTYYLATDDQGRFQSDTLPAGSYLAGALLGNQPPFYFNGTYSAAAAMRVEVSPEQAVQNVDITLPAVDYARVRGVVVDAGMHPVPQATVYLNSDDGWSGYSASSDDDGTWHFDNVFPSGPYSLVARKTSYLESPTAHLMVGPAADVSGISLQLTAFAPALVRGQVNSPNGTPIQSAYVGVTRADNAISTYTYTDIYGSFVVRDLPPGNYNFSTSPTGYNSLNEYNVPIMAGDGNQVTLLPQYNSQGVVSGRVRDASGDPAVHVYVRTGNSTQRSSYSDADGRYTLASVSNLTTSIILPEEPGTPQVSGITVANGSHTAGIDFNLATPYGSIAGDVLDTTGLPLRGIVSLRGEPLPSGSATESVPSSSDGHYLIGRVPVAGGRSYRVRAAATNYPTRFYQNGYLSSEAEPLVFAPGDHRSGIDIVMPDGAVLYGRVRDGEGDPLDSADIRVRWFYGGSSSDYYGNTDSNGNYAVRGLPPGDYTLRFMHSEHLTEYYNHVFAENLATRVAVATAETQRHDVQLTRGGAITGTVRTTTGEVIGQGSLEAYHRDQGMYYYGTVDLDGSYRVPGLPGGDYWLYLSSTGFVDQYYNGVYRDSDAATLIHVATGVTTPGVNFVMQREATISGYVSDGGSPITSGTVYAYDSDGNYANSTGLNGSGNYMLRGLAAGLYRLRATASTYVEEYWPDAPTFAAGAEVVVATAAALTGYDFVLGHGGTLSGTVKNENGDPYTSGSVYLALDSDPLTQFKNTSLSAGGVYTFNGVWPSHYYVYTSLSGKPRIYYPSAFSLATAATATVSEGGSTAGIDIVAPATVASGTISGTVKYADGTPVYAGVYCTAVDGYSGNYSANSDVYTGAFVRAGLTPGTYIIRVDRGSTPSYYHDGTFVSGAAMRLTLHPGETLADLEIVFPDDPVMASVSGMVQDQFSQPVGGASVWLSRSNVYVQVTSQPDGSFAFPSVYPAPGYSLGAAQVGFGDAPEQTLDLAPGQSLPGQMVQLTGYDTGGLAGFLLGPAGTPLGNESVTLQRPDIDYTLYATTQRDGYFYFADVPAGPCRITAYPGGYAYLDVSGVMVTAGAVTLRSFSLQYAAGGVVTGTVRDASHHPVLGVRVRSSNGTSRSAYTGSSGRYALAGLSDGADYRIYLPDEPVVLEATGISVVSGATTENVDFSIPDITYGTVTGTVKNGAANPLANVEVGASGLSGAPSPDDAYSRHNGIYIMMRVRSDAGRSYRVFARDNAHPTQYWNHVPAQALATPVSLAEGASASGINFDLVDGASLSGRVADASGAPLASVSLYATHTGGLGQFSSSSDAAGNFSIGGLLAGDYQLRASLTGYRVEYFDNQVLSANATPVTLSTGEARGDLEIMLEDGGFVAGRVRDTTGNPLFHANIYTQSPQTTEGYGSVYSDLAGRYRLTGLPADSYRVRATRNGYLDASVNDVAVAEGATTGLDLVMFAVGQPTWTPTPTPTGSTTPTPTATATRTHTPTVTNTPGITNTPTRTYTPTITNTPKPLDLHADGKVNSLDVLEFSTDWLDQGGGGADLNGDGQIDALDLLIFLEAWEGR